MPDTFNSHVEWLGIPPHLEQPNDYELLAIEPFEPDRDLIAQAADRALARVRSFRPGHNAAAWAQLLDRLTNAKACLLDAGRKAEYDQGLRENKGHSVAGSSEGQNNQEIRLPDLKVDGNPKYPPRTSGAPKPQDEAPAIKRTTPSYGGFPSIPYSSPPALYGTGPFPLPVPAAPMAAYNPQAPIAFGSNTAGMGVPMSPAFGVPFAGPELPAGTALVPQAAPVANGIHDPMAPLGVAVAIPVGGNYGAPIPTGSPVSHVDSPPTELPRSKSSARMAKEQARSSSHWPLLAAGVVGLFLLICVGLFLAYGNIGRERHKGDGKQVASKGQKHKAAPSTPLVRPEPQDDPQPEPNPKPKHEPSPEPEATPEPKPEPIPEPKPEPTPEPKPEPKPEPIPEPKPEPKPEIKPTAQELAALGKALKTARLALGENNLDEADAALAKAAPLAKLEEHQAKVERLKDLAHYVREFWQAVDEGRQGLEGGNELLIGSTPISVVEPGPGKFIYKSQGEIFRLELRDLPGGIAVALARRALKENDPATKVILGAIYAASKNADKKTEARRNWEEALAAGADIKDLLPVLDDMYEFEEVEP